ncbi:MAG TPA: accessory factor UbiK family protein [Pseudomonadales bacterium]|nr:accessory factor UbiK family protein [Pseudomonadales bacterium]
MNSEQVRDRIEQLLQQSPFASLSSDMRLLMQSQLNALISKANLVSREEFEVQSDALQRTQIKLAELEEKIQLLEQN